MDFQAVSWDKSNIEDRSRPMANAVPTYGLYGERRRERPDFWLHCETIAARSSAYHWEIALHRHESFFQLLYIRNGAGDAILPSGTAPLSPPCVVTMPPGVSHGYRFTRDVDGFVVTVVSDHLRLTEEFRKRAVHWLGVPQVVSLQGSDGEHIGATMQRLAEEFDARRSGRNELIETYLATLLMLIGRQVDPQRPDIRTDGREARVEMLRELIGRNFRMQMQAAHYARILNLSPTHLNRIVRAVTGMTVHDLIMSRVIDEARRALVFTPATIQQIADNLGFADAAYFSRCFRRRTGQTPGAFRREERQKLAEA